MGFRPPFRRKRWSRFVEGEIYQQREASTNMAPVGHRRILHRRPRHRHVTPCADVGIPFSLVIWERPVHCRV